MKKVYKDKIINIPNTDPFDQSFLFEYLTQMQTTEREVFSLGDLLETKKNLSLLPKLAEKPAMWSEVYSPKDELDIFNSLFEMALREKKKIHISGVTLAVELEILENYYTDCSFLREDINAFVPDFSKALITLSCPLENLIWKGSDYKAMRERIFFCPPIRESGENKALFKGITRGVLCGIDTSLSDWESGYIGNFFQKCIREEKVLPLQLAKILSYNWTDAGFQGEKKEITLQY